MLFGGSVFSRQHAKTRPLFISLDILLIFLAFEAAYAIRSALPFERAFFLFPAVKSLLLFASCLFFILTGLWFQLYDSILRDRPLRLFAQLLRQSFFAIAAIVLFQYLQRIDLSRTFLAAFFSTSVILLALSRFSARWIARRILGADSAKRFVLVAGSGDNARRVGSLIEASSRYGLQLLGFLDDNPGALAIGSQYRVYAFSELRALLRQHVVDDIVFAVRAQDLQGLEEIFLICDEEGVRTRFTIDFFPHVHSRVSLEQLEGEPMLTFAGAPHDDVALMAKRAFDFSVSLVALLILSPLLLLVALLVKATSPGPAIFRQRRCGLNGRMFTLYKFRTMVADAEARRAEVEHLNVKKTAFKIPNDPRLTPVGRWLRKFSLDEFPQLLNVLKGEMSIVGPRPPVPEEVANYLPWQRRRLRMRPGLTCLWTLSGRDEVDFQEWMRLDLAYIDSWSLLLDLSIILRTVPIVLLGRGAN